MCRDIPVPTGCQKIPCLPQRGRKENSWKSPINYVNVFLQILDKNVFEMSIQTASETSFPDWQKETCYWRCHRKKNICWKISGNALALVWEADNAKGIYKLMQVHHWARCIEWYQQSTSKAAKFSPVASNLRFSHSVCVGSGTGVIGSMCSLLILTKPSMCVILSSVGYYKVAQHILLLAY